MSTRFKPISQLAMALFIFVGAQIQKSQAVEILDDPIQIDELAAQVVKTSNSLCWEMYRHHQQQPNYQPTYRTAKELWKQASELRELLRNDVLETEKLHRQVAQIDELFVQLDREVSKWGDGDRTNLAAETSSEPRTVVSEGVVVDLPIIGVQVGRPRYTVVEDQPPALQRRRLHPNSHGSKRSLQRELAAVKQSVAYLLEDAGENPEPPAPKLNETQPPEPTAKDADSESRPPTKIVPRNPK